MKRSSRMLLGISVAVITAAALHFTVGNRFHHRAFGNRDCGHSWRKYDRDHHKSPEETSPENGDRF